MKIIIPAIFVAAGLFLSSGKLLAQDKSRQVDSLMQGFHRNGQFTGAVLVAEGGRVLYQRGFGKADRNANTPNQSNTVFYIASLTKPFTALLVMQLVEAGRLKLESTLGDHFAGLKNESVRKVTTHQLLSHTSGIPDFIGPGLVPEKGLTDEWLTGQLDKITPEEVPAGEFRYANSTYIVLAHLIEKIQRKPYALCLEEQVLNKCGMTRSGSVRKGKAALKCAAGYIQQGDAITQAPQLDLSVFTGAGSVYSTVEDLFRFDQALYSQKLISAKHRDLMFSSTRSYGYGWFVRQVPGVGKAVSHEGGIPGYNSLLFRAVEKNYSVVLLSNHDSDGANMQQITRSLVGVLNGR